MEKKHLAVLLVLGLGLIFFIVTIVLMFRNPRYDVWSMEEMSRVFDQYCLENHGTAGDPVGVPVLYINLDRSKKRREFMERQLGQLSLDYERISAVDGRALSSLDHGVVNDVSFENHYSLSAAELGCTLSHILAAKRLLERDLEVALIMEDDCVCYLVPHWDTTIPRLMQRAPEDWEIIQLFSIKRRCIDDNDIFVTHKTGRGYCYSTGAYLLNKQGAASIMRYCGIQCARSGDCNVILGLKQNRRRVTRSGTADKFIYDLARTYVYSTPLFFMGDELMASTIHRSHESEHIAGSHKTVSIYKRRNEQLQATEALVQKTDEGSGTSFGSPQPTRSNDTSNTR